MQASKSLYDNHSFAVEINNSGVTNKKTMRELDVLCLKNIGKMQPAEIRQLREKEQVSQSVFAAYLNTSVSAIRKWESGEKKPSGMALRLLNLIKQKGLGIIL